MQKIIILFGVSGCGKTTIGQKLSQEIGIPFFDADDFHPKKNIQKMKNKEPLNDQDREPWLQKLKDSIEIWKENKGAILACSALKERYRKKLSEKTAIQWVFLNGDFELILNRIQKRTNHYMKSTLLQSQFDALEVPNYGLHIDISKNVNEIVSEIKNKLHE